MENKKKHKETHCWLFCRKKKCFDAVLLSLLCQLLLNLKPSQKRWDKVAAKEGWERRPRPSSLSWNFILFSPLWRTNSFIIFTILGDDGKYFLFSFSLSQQFTLSHKQRWISEWALAVNYHPTERKIFWLLWMKSVINGRSWNSSSF